MPAEMIGARAAWSSKEEKRPAAVYQHRGKSPPASMLGVSPEGFYLMLRD
jgi:hypothetical protein